MKRLGEYKTKIWMIILVMLMQIILPTLTVLLQSSFTLTSEANGEWDISELGNGSVIATLENGNLTISGKGNMKDWTYLSSNRAPWYNSRTEIKEVLIQEGVTSIGEYAFYDCTSLESIIIPETMRNIRGYSFYGCTNLTEIEIPKNVTKIEENAFNNFLGLQKIIVDEANENYSAVAGILYNKNKTKLVAYPAGKPATNYETPSSLIEISYDAFSECENLKKITISDLVTKIGTEDNEKTEGYVFVSCKNLKEIVVSEDNSAFCTDNGILYNKDKTIIMSYPAGKKTISFEIPNTVTTIGKYAFYEQIGLNNITLSEKITNIDAQTFYGCINLKKVVIQSNIEGIGEEAFYNCKSLETITIPTGTKQIGKSAFDNCTSLSKITIPSSVEKIGDYAFRKCEKLEQVTIEEGVKTIGAFAFSECEALTKIAIPTGVTTIGSEAFSKCEKLINIIIPNSVQSIGSSCFEDCISIVSLKLPADLQKIEASAFSGCTNLVSITLPEGIEEIGRNLFKNCERLKTIIIPSTVSKISHYAFYNCTSLESIMIPDTVIEIGDYAFSGCGVLTIYCKNNEVAENYAYENNISIVKDSAGPTIDSMTFYKASEASEEIIMVVTASDEISGLASRPYSFDEGANWQLENKKIIDNNMEKITIMIKDAMGNMTTREILREDIITVADTTPPVIESVTGNKKTWSFEDIVLTVTATDEGVGLGEKAYSFDGGNTWQEENSKAFSVNTKGIEIKVKDLLGNIATYSELINIEKLTSWDVSATEEDNVIARIDTEGTLTISGKGNMKNWEEATNVPWYSIRGEIKKVVTDEGVTNITKYALYNSKNLETIKISGTVINIGENLFAECTTLSKIDVDDTNINYSSENGVLYNKEKTTLICYPVNKSDVRYQVLNTMTTIDSKAFENCSNLKEIIIPNNITNIAEDAFNNEELTIYCTSTSYAKQYATEQGIKCIVDDEGGKITSIEKSPTTWTNGTVIVRVKATDTGVGLAETPYSFDGGVTWQEENTNTYSENKESLEIRVKDKLGNIGMPSGTVDITNIDTEAPVITKIEKNISSQNTEVELKIISSDNGAGLAAEAYSFDGGNTWQSGDTKKYTENESNIVIKVKDAVGNVATSEAINITEIVDSFKVIIQDLEELKKDDITYLNNISVGTTVEEILGKIETNGEIKVYLTGLEVTDMGAIVKTGMKVEITSNKGEKQEYILAVKGDVNGDGKADLNDILSINRHRLNKVTVEGAYLLAGDVDGNGKADLNDILKLNRYRLGKIESL